MPLKPKNWSGLGGVVNVACHREGRKPLENFAHGEGEIGLKFLK